MKTKLALGLLLLVAACGDEDRPEQVAPGTGATGGTSSTGGSAGSSSGGTAGNGDGGEDNVMPGAPVVTVTRPDALAHPNDGEVLVGDEVKALCRVTKSPDAGSQPVNPSTVQIQALDAGGSVVAEAAGTPTSNSNEYSAELIIASVPNGIVSFRCSGSDTSEIPVVGEHMISTFVDHGPAINVKNPLPDSAHALLGSLRFEFTVDPAPLADGDDGAVLSEVELEVNGVTVDTTHSGDNLYEVDVNLADPLVFPTTPSEAVPVMIRASNIRTPIAGERFENFAFSVDANGPVIDITSHVDEDIVGGQTVLEFSVVDALVGVDPESVVVEINQVQHRYDSTDGNWSYNSTSGAFTYRIDSRNAPGSIAQLTIDIDATDTVGNPSTGESLTLFLDTKPPTVDMEPGNVRERNDVGFDTFCTNSFDPVGASPNDLNDVVNFILPRTLVWDETNSGPGQSYFYYAAADQSSVYLYLQDQTAVPLAVDTDQDGTCDDIDRDLDLPFIRLNPIFPIGAEWFGSEGDLEPAIEGMCTLKGDLAEPDYMCEAESSDMKRVIQHAITSAEEPVIYGKGSITDLECTGGEWELTPVAQEGWVCLVTVAKDTVGNRAISPPLRLCFDNPMTVAEPTCLSDKSNPPSCTANCTPPPHWAARILELH